MSEVKIRPDSTRHPRGSYPGLGPTAVAQIRRLAQNARVALAGNAMPGDMATGQCKMCNAEWPMTDFFPAAGDGRAKDTCPHCRYRSAFKAAQRDRKANRLPDPEWGIWQPSGPMRSLATPCYDPFTGAVWSAAPGLKRTPCFAASRHEDLDRLIRFLPQRDASGRAITGPDGCWLMAFPDFPPPQTVPAEDAPAHKPARVLAPSLFDSPFAVPGTAVLHVGTGEFTLSQDDGSVYITLKVGLDALRRIIGKD